MTLFERRLQAAQVEIALGIEEPTIAEVFHAALTKGVNLKPEVEGCPAHKKLKKVGDKRLLAIAKKVRTLV